MQNAVHFPSGGYGRREFLNRVLGVTAASIAGLFLTTEAVVADKPEKEKAPAGAPGGGGAVTGGLPTT